MQLQLEWRDVEAIMSSYNVSLLTAQLQRLDGARGENCLPLGATAVELPPAACWAYVCFVEMAASQPGGCPKAKQRHGIALSNMSSGVGVSGMPAASVLNPAARTPALTARLSWAPGTWPGVRASRPRCLGGPFARRTMPGRIPARQGAATTRTSCRSSRL